MTRNRNVLLFLIFVLLIIASTLVPVSTHAKGSVHIALQVLKGLLITLSWITLYSFLRVFFFERYKQIYKKDVPGIALTVIKFLIVVGAFLSIIVFVLDKSIFSILALGGLVSAGLTFALGELILDAFAGVILETESPFEIHDWIKTLDGNEGQVIEVNWRTVILEHIDGYLIVVPHRKMAQGFINYSKPQKSYWDNVQIALDHTIPVERAERIMRAGAMGAPSVHQSMCDVSAISADAGGITYEVRYLISDRKESRRAKHDVIDYVSRHLHAYKLRISEVIGEYAISKGGKPYQEESPLTVEKLIKNVDFFKSLPKSAIIKLSENAQRRVFSDGEKIVREGEEGQSMFLIGEGVVEISIAYKSNEGVKKEKKLFRLGFPESFGEMALLLNEKRSATVTAVINTVVYEISQDLLKNTLKNYPKAFDKLKKQAIDKREKNKLTKAQMEKLKEKKVTPEKGLLMNLKKFFK